MHRCLMMIMTFAMCVFIILSLVVDKVAWDESRYMLASYDNYNHHSYITYESIDTNKHVTQHSLPYPNLLYTWTFGAFNHFFNLPTDTTARILFTVVLTALLMLCIIGAYFLLQKKKKTPFSCLEFFFFIGFLTYSFWSVRGTQVGSSLLLLLSVLLLILSQDSRRIGCLFEILSVIFLFLACAWKEQLYPILVLYPWFMATHSFLWKKRYRVILYYIALFLSTLVYIHVIWVFSLNAGFSKAQYFYAHEAQAWLARFHFIKWLENVLAVPTTYYVFIGAYFFIKNKEYLHNDKLSNKLFVVAAIQYVILMFFYSYQGTSYLAVVNYYVPVLSFLFFFEIFKELKTSWDKRSLFLFMVMMCIPLCVRTFSNYYPSRGHTISYWLQDDTAPLPCIQSDKIVAVNIFTLGGVQIPQQYRYRPVFEYTLLPRSEFLKGLEKLAPEMIVYYRDETEYADVDNYMNDFYNQKYIQAGNIRYVLNRNITVDTFIFLRQASSNK